MQNLLLLLIRNGGIFVFLFLEVVAFFLIVQFNQEQRAIYLNTAKNGTDLAREGYNGFTDYFSLRTRADSLAAENARLRALLDNAQYDNRFAIDTARNDSQFVQYTYLPARVVKNSVSRINNTLTLNRGSRHGVQPNSGVVGAQGVVGIVRNVTGYYSDAMSILHQQSSISVRLVGSNYFGSVVWREPNPQYANLEEVPQHADLRTGDRVQTSGFSSLFPEGIPVGTVDTFWLPTGSNYYRARIRLATDMANLRDVYIVQNWLRDEQAISADE